MTKAEKAEKFGTIKVSTPCTCGYDHGYRWWNCKTALDIATYTLNRCLDGGMAHPEDVKFVAKENPGADLIFYDGGRKEIYKNSGITS